jgi:hypothetical protein
LLQGEHVYITRGNRAEIVAKETEVERVKKQLEDATGDRELLLQQQLAALQQQLAALQQKEVLLMQQQAGAAGSQRSWQPTAAIQASLQQPWRAAFPSCQQVYCMHAQHATVLHFIRCPTPRPKIIYFRKTDPQALAALRTERQIKEVQFLCLFWRSGGTSSTSSTWTAGVLLQTERQTKKFV